MSLPSMLVMSIAPTRFSFAYGLSGCHCQALMSSFGGGKEGPVVRYLCCGTDPHHLLLVRYGSFTCTPSGQTCPCVAAVTQILTTALGPLSVKSAKKLLGSVLKAVSPSLTVSVVTKGKGMVMSALACLPCNTSAANSNDTSTRKGG